jgi:hypothetical protein
MAFEETPFEAKINALVKLLEWLEQEVANIIAEMVARGVKGTASLQWAHRRQRLLQAHIANVQEQAHKTLPTIMEEAEQSGLYMAGIRGDFGKGINTDAINLLAQGLRDDVDASLATLGRRVNDVFRELTLKQVALHIVAGTGAKASAQTLEREIVKRGTRAFVDKAGRQWSLASYTDMAIRTVTREAMSQATASGLEQNGHDLVKFSHHQGSCIICMPYDGKTFALPGHKVKGYRTLQVGEIPPIHPRCKHVIGPAPARFDQLESSLLAWKAQHAA